MKVSEIMSSEVYSLYTSQSLRDAARLFLEKRIDGTPVLNDEGEIVGLLGKSHLYRAIADGHNIDGLVIHYMERKVQTIDIEEEVSKLEGLSYGRLPVVHDGKMVGMVTKTDVSAALFKMLHTVSQEIHAVIDSAHNAIVSIDSNGCINILNQPAERIFELKREEVIGKPLTDFMPQSNLVDILKTGKSDAGRRFLYKDKILISNRTPLKIGGKITGAVAVLQDISELETISKELKYTREIKEEVDAIIRSSFDGIYVTDGNGKTLMINEAYSRITGINASDVVGKNMRDLVASGVYDRSATLLVMERRETVTLTQEIKITGKTILVTGNPIFDKEGNLFRVVTNVRDITELNLLKQEVKEAQRLSLQYQEQLRKMKVQGCEKYVVNSDKSRDLLDLILRLGQVDSTVLIQGESGVGKEGIAEILHNNSLRRKKPFIRINCGAIPENLLESELFGYEAGAFTGAQKGGKMGLFEVAHGGTLFLDEIGELPMFLQVKLLRAIQEREINRVGATQPIKIDVRIIAATNRDLWDMVVRNQFRKDLYYRLNVVPVTVASLRERREEIPALISHFMDIYNKKYGLNKSLHQKALKQMLEYEWPGNVRELENVIERSIVTTQEQEIMEINSVVMATQPTLELAIQSNLGLKEAVESLEKHLILETIERMGSTRKTANALGVSQPTIVRKAARYGIRLGAD